MLLFLVLAGNSALFRFTHSYSSHPFLCAPAGVYSKCVFGGVCEKGEVVRFPAHREPGYKASDTNYCISYQDDNTDKQVSEDKMAEEEEGDGEELATLEPAQGELVLEISPPIRLQMEVYMVKVM